MYNSFQLAKKYIHYYLNASNSKGHGMHSPFVFDFILNVLNNKNGYTPPSFVESLRKELLLNKELLKIEDFGAGSRLNSSNEKSVSALARHALKPKKYAQLLYRLVRHYQPQTIIELGTSLGITTSYLATANPFGKVITLEGSEAIAQKAKTNFEKLGITNIHSLQGNFDAVLPTVLSNITSIDLGYIDGNHRYEPTLNYFNQILQKTHSHSILVFDDIHWSKEMENAWTEIKAHPAVQYTIDIFFLGFVFFKEEFRVKQHFMIRF